VALRREEENVVPGMEFCGVDLQAAGVEAVALLHESGGVDDYSGGTKIVREREAQALNIQENSKV
jgi:hypothetical protein